jgi:hypothetical protein
MGARAFHACEIEKERGFEKRRHVINEKNITLDEAVDGDNVSGFACE